MSNAASARPAPLGYVWQIPGSSFRIHVNHDLIRDLQANFGNLSSPRMVRRDEIRGFLHGQVTGSDVHINAVEPWPAGPGNGPTPVPLDATAIGHVRRLENLNEADVVMLELVVDAVGPLCLLLRIRPDGSVTATAPAPEPAAKTGRRKPYLVATMLGAALLGGSAVAFYASRQTPAPPAEAVVQDETVIPRHVIVGSVMSLSATKGKGDVVITWNGKHPSLSDARIGVLSIQDGEKHTEMALTRAQIQANRATYSPRSSQLEIRLDVFSASGKPTSDSMIVDLVSRSGESVRSRSAPVADANTTVRVRNIPADERAAPPMPRAFVTPSAPVVRSTRETVLTDVPALQRTGQTQTVAANRAPEFLPGLPSSVPPPAAPPAARPESAKVEQSAAQVTPSSPIPNALTVKPPQVLRRVRPEVPANVLSGIRKRTTVQVRLVIDEQGKVTKAESQGGADPVSIYLGNVSAGAARLWTFEPGKRGNTPVRSEMIVEFVFGTGK